MTERVPKGHVFNLEWKPLADVACSLHRKPGVYFLGAPFRIGYGSTESRVFYIGSSGNLGKRLTSHLRRLEKGNYLLLKIASPSRGNITCCAFSLPEVKASTAVKIEGEAIYSFGVKHGFVPYGNWMPTVDTPSSYECTVAINEAASPELELLTVDDIGGRYCLQVEKDPYPVFNRLAVTFNAATGKIEAEGSPKIFRIIFRELKKAITSTHE